MAWERAVLQHFCQHCAFLTQWWLRTVTNTAPSAPHKPEALLPEVAAKPLCFAFLFIGKRRIRQLGGNHWAAGSAEKGTGSRQPLQGAAGSEGCGQGADPLSKHCSSKPR